MACKFTVFSQSHKTFHQSFFITPIIFSTFTPPLTSISTIDPMFRNSLLPIVTIIPMLISCIDNGPAKSVTLTLHGIAGLSNEGTVITIQSLDSKMKPTGDTHTVYTGALGSYTFNDITLSSSFVRLMATGYFYNIVTGEYTAWPLTINAISEVSDGDTVNINLLTHVMHERIVALITAGSTYSEARRQTQRELVAEFGFFQTRDERELLLTADSYEAGMYTAISSLISMERLDRDLDMFINRLSGELAANGEFSFQTHITFEEEVQIIKPWLNRITQNITEYYKDTDKHITIPDLLYFFDWNGDRVAGNEILTPDQRIILSKDEVIIANEGGRDTVTISSPVEVFMNIEEVIPPFLPIDPDPWDSLYTTIHNDNPVSKVKFDGHRIMIEMFPLDSGPDKGFSIPLYDYLGNEVVRLVVTQKGNGLPTDWTIGGTAERAIANIRDNITALMIRLQQAEDLYANNPVDGRFNELIHPKSIPLSQIFETTLHAPNSLIQLKDAEAARKGLYQRECTFWLSLVYLIITEYWDNPLYRPSVDEPERQLRKSEILSLLLDDVIKADNGSERPPGPWFLVRNDATRYIAGRLYLNQGKPLEADRELALIKQDIEAVFPAVLDTLAATTDSITVISRDDIELMRAECHYMLGNHDRAAEFIAAVASRHNLPVSADIPDCLGRLRIALRLYPLPCHKRLGTASNRYNVTPEKATLPFPSTHIFYIPGMSQNSGW